MGKGRWRCSENRCCWLAASVGCLLVGKGALAVAASVGCLLGGKGTLASLPRRSITFLEEKGRWRRCKIGAAVPPRRLVAFWEEKGAGWKEYEVISESEVQCWCKAG